MPTIHSAAKQENLTMLRQHFSWLLSFNLVIFFPLMLMLLTGCSKLLRHQPPTLNHSVKSIVVLPPMNKSVEVSAPYIYLSTITKPLAERGYYVYPVAVVDALLKQNGLPTPVEMHAIPLKKIREHIGADAVLYVTIEDWGQKYRIVESRALVRIKLNLVDTKSGRSLWRGSGSADSGGSSDNVNGWEGKLVAAVVDQIVGSLVDGTRELAKTANERVIERSSNPLPPGPYLKEK